MARNIHWKVPFYVDGTSYCVNIYEDNYTGSSVILKGTTEPFATDEDDDEDVFTPIRTSTGYINIVATASVIDEILPKHNLERFIVLSKRGQTVWQGFITAEIFEQQWNDTLEHEFSLPVHSLLEALKDVKIATVDAGSVGNIGMLIYKAITQLSNYSLAYSSLIQCLYISNFNNDRYPFFIHRINWSIFFDEDTIINEGSERDILKGWDFYSVLSKICSFYGVTLHEYGRDWYFTAHDLDLVYRRLSTTQFYNLITGGSVAYTIMDRNEADFLSSVDCEDNDPTISVMGGAYSFKVSGEVSKANVVDVQLPDCDEDSSTVITVPNINNGTVYVQPHSPRTGTNETFSYKEVSYLPIASGERPSTIGDSSYQNCLNNSVLYRPLFNPNYDSYDHAHTGAFPCRFFHKKGTEGVTLESGLFLSLYDIYANGAGGNTRPINNGVSPNFCYEIDSKNNVVLKNGWININFDVMTFIRGELSGDKNNLYFHLGDSGATGIKTTTMYCGLKYGNKYWNGSAWEESSNLTPFTIKYKQGEVVTNKTSDIDTTIDGGLFIPISEEMAGVMKFFILNVARTSGDTGDLDGHCMIMQNLHIQHCRSNSITSSSRNSNVYYKEIITGFTDSKEIDTNIITANNNIESISFLKDKDGNNIESLTYLDADGETYTQRPEIHLLERMASYWGESRRILQIRVKNTLVIPHLTVYTYKGKKYRIVSSSTDWYDGTTRLKLIEI